MNPKRELGPYLARLPIGRRLSAGELLGDPLFPFEGEILVDPLDPPIIPEPHRNGEGGGQGCWSCAHPGAGSIWASDRWRVRADPERPHGLPAVAVLEPLAHHDLPDLPPQLAVELGPMIQRLARAIGALPDVGRVHVNRWGDGSEHFHVWFLARPLGMWQMRGAMLAVWDDLLPKLPPEEWRHTVSAIAAALARDGGEALI